MTSPRLPVSSLLALVAALLLPGCRTQAKTVEDPALIGRPEPGPTQETDRGTLWYRIAAAGDSLDITIRLLTPPKRTSFFMPGSWAGRNDYARRIRITGARGPEGPRFMTIDRQEGRIEVDSEEAPWVELSYAVDLDTDRNAPRLHPRATDGVLLAYGPTFLVLPSQQILDRTRQIPVELNVPDAWRVHTTWRLAAEHTSKADPSRRIFGFLSADGRQLRDAFLVAGPALDVHDLDVEGSPLEIAFHPRFEGEEEALSDAVTRLVAYYRDTFGDLGPVKVYVDVRPDVDGEELSGLGRRGGFVLELPGDAEFGCETTLLVAHEALHLWNGHNLVPAPSIEEKTRWFKEGVTHYLALKAMRRLELCGRREVLDELARAAANYARNPVSRGHAGRTLDQARYPYDFGVLLGLAIDAELHRTTRGREGVESWLIALDDRIDEERGAEYDDGDLYAALRDVEAENNGQLSALWDTYVRRRKTFGLQALFESVGLHWLPPEPSRSPRLIALDDPSPLYRKLFQ